MIEQTCSVCGVVIDVNKESDPPLNAEKMYCERCLRDVGRWETDGGAPARSKSALVVFLDFSSNQLMRANGKSVPLPRGLPIRALEQLCRTGEISNSRFPLLSRERPSPGHASDSHLLQAIRHESSILQRFIVQADLPIEIWRERNGIFARLNSEQMKTNISEAQALAKKAIGRCNIRDFTIACNFAARALAADFDCGHGASVVLRLLKVARPVLDSTTILRAQISLARSMTRCAAALRRLTTVDYRGHVYLDHAHSLATRWFEILATQWRAIVTWRPSSDEFDQDSVRSFVQSWVNVVRAGDVNTYQWFIQSRIMVNLMERLVTKRLQHVKATKYKEIADRLAGEIFSKLNLHGWLPPAAMSEQEMQECLLRFLARRINWEAVL